jgi:hypothetical protein
MDHLFIVVHRVGGKGLWRTDEVFEEKRLAENFKEIKEFLDSEPKNLYAVVEGGILVPEDIAEAEARLRAF